MCVPVFPYIKQTSFFISSRAHLKNACHENNTAWDFASQRWNKFVGVPLSFSPPPLMNSADPGGLDPDGYQRACPKTWPRHMVAWQGSKFTSVKYDSKTSSAFADTQPERERGKYLFCVVFFLTRSMHLNLWSSMREENLTCVIRVCKSKNTNNIELLKLVYDQHV